MTTKEKENVAKMRAEDFVFSMRYASKSDTQWEESKYCLENLFNRFLGNAKDIVLVSDTNANASFNLVAAAFYVDLEEAFENSASIAKQVENQLISIIIDEME